MTTVWLVLSLTNSPFLSSLNDFASQVPIVLLGLFSGVLIDRMDKRHLIQATQFVLMTLAFAMAIMTFTNKINYTFIFMISVCLGCVNAFDMPARQACISLMVDRPDHLTNAIAINSAVFNLSRVIGPSVAGFAVTAIGESYCYFFTGLAFIAPIYALSIMKLRPQVKANTEEKVSIKNSILEGLSYVRQNAHLKITLLMVSAVCFLAMPIYVTFSALVKLELKTEASLFGLILGGVGLGALVSTFKIAALPDIRGLPRRIFWSLLLLGFGILAMALSKNHAVLVIMAAFVGMGFVYTTTGCNTMLQTFISDNMRGRVMSLYVMSFSGASPLGSLVAGIIMDKVNVLTAIFCQGLLCIVTAFFYIRYIKVLDNKIQSLHHNQEYIAEERAM